MNSLNPGILFYLLLTGVLLPPFVAFTQRAVPLARFMVGYVNYDLSYRSNIDTPYTERDITQHNITGRIDIMAGKVLPLSLNYWVRKSNSSLYRDMAGVQVQFDANSFKQQWQARHPTALNSIG